MGLVLSYRGISADYFQRQLADEMRRRWAREDNAPLMSIHFAQAEHLLAEEMWWTLSQHLQRYANDLATAGVEALMLGSLTWYAFADRLDPVVPLFHPVDALERELARRSQAKSPLGILAGSLSVRRGPLMRRFRRGRERSVILPSRQDNQRIDAIIEGSSPPASSRIAGRQFLLRVIDSLAAEGAEAIVLGAPELTAILAPEDFQPNYYDLPALQVATVADWMVASRPRLLP